MPLQKQFRGLSDALGLFRGGNVTLELAPEIHGQFQAEKFLMEPTWIHNQSTPINWTLAQRATVDIPANENWIVWHIGGVSSAALAVGNNLGVTPIYAAENLLNFVPLGDRNEGNAFEHSNAGSMFSFGKNFENGIWLQGGGRVGFYVTYRTGVANINVLWSILYSKFQR